MEHEHCFHLFRGVFHMVLPDGHVLEKCCKCQQTRVIHAEHSTRRAARGIVRGWITHENQKEKKGVWRT